MEEEDKKEKGSWFCSTPEDFSLAKTAARFKGEEKAELKG